MNESALLTAVGITLGVATVVVLVLHRPMHGMLTKVAREPATALFWTVFGDLLLMLCPLTALLLGAGLMPLHVPPAFTVAWYVGWSLLGLIATLFLLAGVVVYLVKPLAGSVHVTTHQMDDMQRLLAKVDQIRAREVLRRFPDPSES
jgi:hypothetical protein